MNLQAMPVWTCAARVEAGAIDAFDVKFRVGGNPARRTTVRRATEILKGHMPAANCRLVFALKDWARFVHQHPDRKESQS
jgi:hypothetical protein